MYALSVDPDGVTARLKDIRLVEADKISHAPSVILRALNEFEIEFSKR